MDYIEIQVVDHNCVTPRLPRMEGVDFNITWACVECGAHNITIVRHRGRGLSQSNTTRLPPPKEVKKSVSAKWESWSKRVGEELARFARNL